MAKRNMSWTQQGLGPDQEVGQREQESRTTPRFVSDLPRSSKQTVKGPEQSSEEGGGGGGGVRLAAMEASIITRRSRGEQKGLSKQSLWAQGPQSQRKGQRGGSGFKSQSH